MILTFEIDIGHGIHFKVVGSAGFGTVTVAVAISFANQNDIYDKFRCIFGKDEVLTHKVIAGFFVQVHRCPIVNFLVCWVLSSHNVCCSLLEEFWCLVVYVLSIKLIFNRASFRLTVTVIVICF